jgi:hypothetical protein
LLHTFVDASDAYDVSGVPPGTPVALTATLSVDGAISTTGCGGSGPPPGASVTSCRGYSLGPTPAKPSSWGRLKIRYR